MEVAPTRRLAEGALVHHGAGPAALHPLPNLTAPSAAAAGRRFADQASLRGHRRYPPSRLAATTVEHQAAAERVHIITARDHTHAKHQPSTMRLAKPISGSRLSRAIGVAPRLNCVPGRVFKARVRCLPSLSDRTAAVPAAGDTPVMRLGVRTVVSAADTAPDSRVQDRHQRPPRRPGVQPMSAKRPPPDGDRDDYSRTAVTSGRARCSDTAALRSRVHSTVRKATACPNMLSAPDDHPGRSASTPAARPLSGWRSPRRSCRRPLTGTGRLPATAHTARRVAPAPPAPTAGTRRAGCGGACAAAGRP
jgi:hypothetical protein